MNKSILLLILPTLLITPIISLSLNSWLSMWISMEINFMSYIPLMIFLNKFNKNISNKYFIVQTISSTIFLCGVCLDFLFNSPYMNFLTALKIFFLNLSLFIKLGLPPFQNWFIDLMKNSSWMNCIILSNWQKIIPMIIINHTYNLLMIYLTIFICLLITPMGLNFSSTKMIMSISSINQMGWILLIMINKELSWKWYFIFYMILNSSIMYYFKKFNINYINQMNNLNNYFNNYYLIMMIMSISGIPPFLGFLIKLLTIKSFFQTPLILTFMIISTLTFIMYTRICYKLILNNLICNKMKLFIKFNILNLNNIMILSMPLTFWLISFNWTS